jgi:hypothetical protein
MKPLDPDLEPERDPELGRLLDEWQAPAAPDSLDQRVRASFRQHVRRPGLWRRFVTTSVRIPLPVALVGLLLLVFVLWSGRRPLPRPESAESMAPTQAARLGYAARPLVTRTNLAGFKPVREINVTLLPGSVSP